MAFHYRLETLFRLRRSLEHQEENRLLVWAARIAGLKTDLEAWQNARQERHASLQADLEKGAPGTFVQIANLWEQGARAREKEIREQLRLAEVAQEQQLKVYRTARQKRETLESLKEDEENIYASEQLRRIQRDLDEAHLQRLFLISPDAGDLIRGPGFECETTKGDKI
jgi:flagellar export protein FliJ